jgi:hypothetical protein
MSNKINDYKSFNKKSILYNYFSDLNFYFNKYSGIKINIIYKNINIIDNIGLIFLNFFF